MRLRSIWFASSLGLPMMQFSRSPMTVTNFDDMMESVMTRWVPMTIKLIWKAIALVRRLWLPSPCTSVVALSGSSATQKMGWCELVGSDGLDDGWMTGRWGWDRIVDEFVRLDREMEQFGKDINVLSITRSCRHMWFYSRDKCYCHLERWSKIHLVSSDRARAFDSLLLLLCTRLYLV